jgi:hypothetical protein
MSRQKVYSQIGELEKYIHDASLQNDDVSNASIGWHIDHCLMVIGLTLANIPASNPDQYKWSFNFWRMVCLSTKRFPRGKAKAPKVVVPLSLKTDAELNQQLAESRKELESSADLHPKQFMKHPYFGLLDREATFRFLEVHTLHHLKIIEEIKRKRKNT